MVYFSGIRYETWGNRLLMHFFHQDILKTKLLESTFHLHAQPPLFNLFIGAILKLYPKDPTQIFHGIYIAFGLLLAISIYLLMSRLGVRDKLALCLTALFIISPSCILFENLLLYTYPVLTLLCLSAVLLVSFLDSGRIRIGIAFFTTISIIVLTRSLFHIIWMCAIVLLIILFQPRLWKQTVIAAIIPFMLAFGVYAKNYMLFGTFSTSTWMGMSFCKMTTFRLPEEKRIELIREGKLSELAVLPSYRGLWYYRDFIYLPTYKETGISVLDIELYPTGGLNYNNLAYISLSQQYMKDGLYVLRHYPLVFMQGLLRSFKIFFFPSSDWFAMLDETNENRQVLKPYIVPLNFILYGQFFNLDDQTFYPDYSWEQYSWPLKKIGMFLAVWVIISFFYGVYVTAVELQARKQNMPRLVTMLFLLMTIVYVTVIGNFLEVGENHRFRFNIDPFLLVFFGLFIQDMASRFTKKDSIPRTVK
ncbi:hypothetical protein ACFL4V_00965 [Candidatus Latescibacterota bacterium]